MTGLTILLALTLIAVWLFSIFQPSKKFRKFGAQFPGPRTYPILGNILTVGVSSANFYSNLWSVANKYGRTFRLFLGKKLFIFVTDPEDIEYILVQCKQVARGKSLTVAGKPWLGEGLLVAPVEKWRSNRKRILPAFNVKTLENFARIFHQNSERLAEEISGCAETEDVEITTISAMYALRNVCETATGVSLDSLSSNDLYPHTIEKLKTVVATKMFVPLMSSRFFYNFHPLSWKEDELLQYVNSITEKVIQSRKNEHSEWRVSSVNYEENSKGQSEPLIFLDLLLNIQKEDPSFSDQQIRDEVNTLMFAGTDAVGATLSFCLYLLSKNRDVQEKIYEESTRILGKRDCPPTFQDLQEMKYLEQVIKETLRIYTPIPMLSRCADSDITLRSGLVIPAEATIFLWAHRMHNNQNIYPNPNVFNPENFSPKNIQRRVPCSFLPFGGGARNCIGLTYAYSELKMGISTLVRNYIFLPSGKQKDLKLINEIVLKAESGIHLKIRGR